MNTQEMSQKVTELVQSGMSMEEALTKVLEENKPAPSTRVQMTADGRVAWISGLNNVSELKKAIKTAFAKKSKSKTAGKPDSIERYEDEIKAGQARLNELMAEINTAADPIAKAMELGEDESAIVQRILDKLEDGLDDKLAKIKEAKNLTNVTLKEAVNAAGASIPVVVAVTLGSIGQKYLEIYSARGDKGDQRIVTLNKRLNYLAKVESEAKAIQAKKEEGEKAAQIQEAPATITEEPKKEEAPEQPETTVIQNGDVTVEVNDKRDRKNRK